MTRLSSSSNPKSSFLGLYLKKGLLSILILLSLSALVLGTTVTASFYYKDRLFPNTTVLESDIGNLSKDEAEERIKSTYPLPNEIVVQYQNQEFKIPAKSIFLTYEYEKTISNVLTTQEPLKLLSKIKGEKDVYSLIFSYKESEFDKLLSSIAAQITDDPVYPKLIVTENSVSLTPSTNGTEIDYSNFYKTFEEKMTHGDLVSITLPIKEINTSLSEAEKEKLKRVGFNLWHSTIVVKFEENTITSTKDELLTLLDWKGNIDKKNVDFFTKKIAESINRDPQNPVFTYDGNTVREFKPAKNGLSLDIGDLNGKLISEISTLSSPQTISIQMKVDESKPDYETQDVNDLGIQTLLGKGTSVFKGSIPSRVHNVVLASSKFNGILIEPGKTFSFNELLGDVSQFTGYKQAYVIKEGKTVLGDGGGVCQVSSTLFRAALNAGLPIVERRPHSYRVSYYEQDVGPGFDATVFAPTTDLKIKNDTPAHILIQTFTDTKNLTLAFEIYGTSDGRVATVSKATVGSSVAPPDDVYVDDPTLPMGTIKQIEHKAWGSKVSFDYKVERNGEVLYQKTFVSNYKPWQAVYLRGTAPI